MATTETTRRVVMSRHYNVRKHSNWTVDVPVGMLDDPRYFDDGGFPTSAFDQWVCDNGWERDIELSPLEDDQLDYEIEAVR